ncbi:ImmA/IrrE family metallo-endopeptidase [Loktanella sp. Alg231-35]|uniref:ImmA/IrrE family metallo-endopeptidase n=1 Tax=Loktanella sp. Alg231-35 TaxID=1922220 RepID=UPI00131F480D|nr:ImmA/IrrE family metallo-endopeptidase [Loktanella sp. Alg231-35]
MQIDRFELADIHHPVVLAKTIHTLLGELEKAVPITEVARELDIQEVRVDRFGGFEGMLLTDKARSTGCILANSSKGNRRARFTIAHELGHFLMERHQLSDGNGFKCMAQDIRESREGRMHLRQETQANQFAIELLAPAYLMTSLFKTDPDLRDAQRLRDHLDLSLEACVRRMVSSRDEPLAAVWSFKGQVRYFVKNDGFPFIAITRNGPLPKTTVAHHATANGRQGFTEMDETDPYVWTGRSHVELFEQTRVAPNGHAVTLLWAELPDEDDGSGLRELGMPGFR